MWSPASLLLLAVSLGGCSDSAAPGETLVDASDAGSYSMTVPGDKGGRWTFEIWGAGGGGGLGGAGGLIRFDLMPGSGGGGGGAGGYGRWTEEVAAGAVIDFTVGAGGLSGAYGEATTLSVNQHSASAAGGLAGGNGGLDLSGQGGTGGSGPIFSGGITGAVSVSGGAGGNGRPGSQGAGHGGIAPRTAAVQTGVWCDGSTSHVSGEGGCGGPGSYTTTSPGQSGGNGRVKISQ